LKPTILTFVILIFDREIRLAGIFDKSVMLTSVNQNLIVRMTSIFSELFSGAVKMQNSKSFGAKKKDQDSF
jgi:hypothetical protein